jgi:hypothetical protein
LRDFLDGGDDAHVGAAAAQVGFHVGADLRFARLRMLFQQDWARITMPAMQ